jgi:ADP-glucose pyrophosphorylase
VPFAGHYRIIDFTLSNCIGSGLKRIYVLTQCKSQSLDDHLRLGWNIFASAFDEFLFSVPPGFSVGYNLEEDAKRFTISEAGVVVIPTYSADSEIPVFALIPSFCAHPARFAGRVRIPI